LSADILIYAIVAAGLVFWLRNVLGTRHGDERQRPNPFTSQPETMNKPAESDMGGIVPPGLIGDHSADISAGLERHMSIANEDAERGLVEIARADRSFELAHFLRGSQDAFVMIIEAFAEGDKDSLRGLLSPSVYDAFEKVIDQRAKDNETANVEIHAVRRAEVMGAQVKDKVAYVTVRFTADETSIVRDENDKVIFGDPDRVTETIDIWTFGRPVRSRDPAWLLYQTREDEDDEENGSTVPQHENGHEK